MITKSPDNDVDTREQIRREGGRARRGSPPLAQQPWPDQLARKAMSSAHHHPRKRDRNRDWKTVPRGSLATD